MSTFANPDARFDHLHLDLIGPLPSSQGCRYLLTHVDRFTRWAEVTPITNSSAETVAQAFLAAWISRFGVPSLITTERGAQFESALWKNLMQLLGSKCIRTTAYHPSANRQVERFHRYLKVALKTKPMSEGATTATFGNPHQCETRPLLFHSRTTLQHNTLPPRRSYPFQSPPVP